MLLDKGENQMSQRVRSTSQKFATLTRRKSGKLVQPIRTKGNILIRGNLIKCLSCKGLPNFSLNTLKSDNGFKPIGSAYPHLEGCTNKF